MLKYITAISKFLFAIKVPDSIQVEKNDMKLYKFADVQWLLYLSILVSAIAVIYLILYLSNKRSLHFKNQLLKDNEAKLQLILDSTAEGIYGIDLNGKCTFCNNSCLRMLKYDKQEDILGRDTHWLFHHSHNDGTPVPKEDCAVIKSIKEGKGLHEDNEVLWRSDGTSFSAEYYSYPQFFDGKLIGAVVTFRDITEQKKIERDLSYLIYHDSLTGLYNRFYLQDKLKDIDIDNNLPISVIMGDVNGLKQTNDIFGHDIGDQLIVKIADVMKKVCYPNDNILRIGGDEFLIILVKTGKDSAKQIMTNITNQLSKEESLYLPYSISLGFETKKESEEDILKIIQYADHNMYIEKTLERRKYNNEIITKIITRLHDEYPIEKEHAENVSRLCREMGDRLNLSSSEIRRLREAGFNHDIGKIILPSHLLNKEDSLDAQEWHQIKQHSVVGFRILNSSDDTVELAKYVLSHHERWDGTGYPKGLKGEEIPRLSRIISIIESYDTMIRDTINKKAISKEAALKEIKKNSETQFDPFLVDVFIDMMR